MHAAGPQQAVQGTPLGRLSCVIHIILGRLDSHARLSQHLVAMLFGLLAPQPLAGQLVMITGCATAASGARGPHPRCITIVADVSKTADCGRLVAQCRNVFERMPDVLINNAACTGNSGPFVQMPAQDITEMLACNIGAPILLARHVLPEMLQRGSGTIVNISSVCVFPALLF